MVVEAFSSLLSNETWKLREHIVIQSPYISILRVSCKDQAYLNCILECQAVLLIMIHSQLFAKVTTNIAEASNKFVQRSADALARLSTLPLSSGCKHYFY